MSNQQEITVKYEVDGSEIKLTPKIVQEYIVGTDSKITLQEFKMFTELCKVRKLNPFLKEVYCIKYGNQPATIVVGKEAILKRALRNPQYDGKESGIIVLNSKTEETAERIGTFYIPGAETVVGGWCRVYRKDMQHPNYVSVSYEESVQRKKTGEPNSMWSAKPATMLEKVAVVRALRESFIDDLGGMIDENEVDTAPDLPPVYQPQPEQEIIQQPEPQDEPIPVNFYEL